MKPIFIDVNGTRININHISAYSSYDLDTVIVRFMGDFSIELNISMEAFEKALYSVIK